MAARKQRRRERERERERREIRFILPRHTSSDILPPNDPTSYYLLIFG
jgi:hypothetical protein